VLARGDAVQGWFVFRRPAKFFLNHLLIAELKMRLFYLLAISFVFVSSPVFSLSAQETDQPKQAPFIPGTIVAPNEKIDNLTKDAFLKAAREGDLEIVKAAIKSGIDVNTPTEYNATALSYACERGHVDVVEYLLEQGADPNIKDTFYNATPLTWAQMKDHKPVMVQLVKHGVEGGESVLLLAVTANNIEFTEAILKTKSMPEKSLLKARTIARNSSNKKKKKDLLALFEPLNLPEQSEFKLDPDTLDRYTGKYTSDQFNAEVTTKDDKLLIKFGDSSPDVMTPVSETEFSLGPNDIQFEFNDDMVETVLMNFNGFEVKLTPADQKKPDSDANASKSESESQESKTEMSEEKNSSDTKQAAAKKGDSDEPAIESSEPKFGPSRAKSIAADRGVSSRNWPSFRGNGARGIGDGMKPPTKWSVEENENVLWKTPVEGLGLSCPTIWGNRIYLTTAVAEGDEGGLKIGLYGDVDSVEEDKVYAFKVLCYSKKNGKLIWEKTANEAKPAVKRHAKSSHANPTVATDGEHVVAFFGTEGLYCYSKKGELLWKFDPGFLDSGWFYDPGYQWGFASSPIIHEDKVIIQCDIQGQSFVAAFNIKNGTEIWRTERDEIPTWSTPTVHKFDDVTMLITNGTKAARGYDVQDGSLLWTLKGHSEIVVPTPNVSLGKIFVASGYSPIQPIYAIDPAARGDISLEENTDTNDSISWSVKRGGPYMPSPIIYGDYLYCCANSGILSCHVAETGEEVYKKRMRAKGGGLSFTASPIAADGYLFLTAEDGRVLIVKAGPDYELVETNKLGESILSTPSISQRAIYFRTQDSLIAVGTAQPKKDKTKANTEEENK
jgi:outer membrane protein assembly factor BamB